MPRWGGWTSDLVESTEVFGRYYPRRLRQMRLAAATGRTPSADPAVLHTLLDDLGPWLAAEYTAAHGVKAPRLRPAPSRDHEGFGVPYPSNPS